MAHDLPNLDPNAERNDTLIPEYWNAGESLQDLILSHGYESETVEGIAVDFHDFCQAVDVIRDELVPACLVPGLQKQEFLVKLRELKAEIIHLEWHARSAVEFLEAAEASLEG